jgi:UDP-glucuronate 4-epimerase
MKILVTGCAGFIGFHLSSYLLKKNINVIGIDNINDYYDINLKKNRLKLLKAYKNFSFNKFDLINKKKLDLIIKKNRIKIIIHLAAQAGVRYSIKNPNSYFKNNLEVFFNILEVSRLYKIKHLMFASTSSVYGENFDYPSKENFNTDNPLSFYAATKKSNEIMAYTYSNIFKLPCTGLRFFTVYGPYGRPDMALFKFTKNILENKKIELFNNGNHARDFTYIDDVINGIFSIINKPKKHKIPFNIFNIGNGNSKKLTEYIKCIELNLGLKAKIKKLPLQKGDIKKTRSDITKLNLYAGYNPKTSINLGIKKFIDWYKEYYKY